MELLSEILEATFSTSNNVKLIVNSQLFVAHNTYLRMNVIEIVVSLDIAAFLH